MKRSPDGVNLFSQMLMNQCVKDYLCTSDCFFYFLGKILLNNYVYCNMILAFVHQMAYLLHEKVVSKIPSPVSIVAFACLLYTSYLGVGALNEQVINRLGIQFKKETDIKSILLNQFYRVCISIASCCLSLFLPLCTVLVITCLMATGYTVGSTLLFPFNVTLAVLAFITCFFSLGQWILISFQLSGGINPLELLEKLFVSELSVFTFFSILGVTVPILMGILYGLYIGGSIFFTFFEFLKITEVVDRLKSSSASVVMLAFFLLMLNVKEVLGNTYAMMTLMLIVLIGMYVITKTG